MTEYRTSATPAERTDYGWRVSHSLRVERRPGEIETADVTNAAQLTAALHAHGCRFLIANPDLTACQVWRRPVNRHVRGGKDACFQYVTRADADKLVAVTESLRASVTG